ncbi:MAG: HNH endonuclease [Sphingomonas sp.]
MRPLIVIDALQKSMITGATVVDHIVPLALGGDDSDANTRSLCTPCHGTRTAEQFGHRSRVATGPDGWPSP